MKFEYERVAVNKEQNEQKEMKLVDVMRIARPDLHREIPFKRHLRYLIVIGSSDKDKSELIHKFFGFKVPDSLFYKDFEEEMAKMGDPVENFFINKPKRDSLEFKECLQVLKIEELAPFMDDMPKLQFVNSWICRMVSLMDTFPKVAVFINILKAMGTPIKEILKEVHTRFPELDDLTEDDLNKYFYYFFDSSNMTERDWQCFIDYLDNESYKNCYNAMLAGDVKGLWQVLQKELL
ncbi:MAG: hypothetical protein WC614_04620 [bacterium]